MQTNQKKAELLGNQKQSHSKIHLILFQNTRLIKNLNFYENFHAWVIWLRDLKPLKKTIFKNGPNTSKKRFLISSEKEKGTCYCEK